MAKKTKPKATTKKKAAPPAPSKKQRTDVALPPEVDLAVASEFAEHEHLELQDQSFPFLKVAQGLSPELEQPEKYPGLARGDIFNTATQEIYDSLVAVPVFYQRTFVEWRPRAQGGGFVADVGLEQGKERIGTCKKKEGATVATILPNGNELIETAYWALIVVDPDGNDVPYPAIFPMSSTFLKPSRDWNTAITKFRIPGADNYIRWARPFTISTEATKNEKGSWHKPVIYPYVPDGWGDGPFLTPNLPIGTELWNSALTLAKTFLQDGLRPTPPEDESIPPESEIDDVC